MVNRPILLREGKVYKIVKIELIYDKILRENIDNLTLVCTKEKLLKIHELHFPIKCT